MLNDPNCTVPPDWQAIYLDDTCYWNLSDEDRPLIERMISVYMYDRNSRTFCCEITPSYCLVHLYNEVWFKSGVSDEERERIRKQTIDQALGQDDPVSYHHCRDIDRLPDDRRKSYGPIDPSDLEDCDDRGEEIVREYWQGNCPF